MASCKQCIHKTVCAIYNDSLRETLERGGTILCQCGEYLPAANVIEIKRGKWEENKYAFCNVCSECGTIVDRSAIKWQSGELNFCPNCGAKMDGEYNEK